MNKRERVFAVLEGRHADRPPVSFWYHFGPDCVAGPRAVEAHAVHAETYDLDFLKIMNDGRYPLGALGDRGIQDAGDLDKLTVLNGEEEDFGRQLEVIRALAGRFAGELPMITTIFNAWSTLRRMTAPENNAHNPPTMGPSVDPRDAVMSRLVREAPSAMARALETVARSLANFAGRCVAAGADGVYLSVREDWVDTPNHRGTYDRLVRPGDLQILAGVRNGTFNMLHVCGTALDFRAFAGYPVHAINWADRTAGPRIAEVAAWVRPALCAGLDNLGTMVNGSPDDCTRQVVDAVEEAGDRPILVSPGCTFDPQAVPAENLHAIRRAVEEQFP